MLEKNIYINSINENNQKALENLTLSKNWDSSKFNEIMVALSLLGMGQSIPAKNSPETIHLQSYRKYFDDLLKKTKETNKEHGRAILVDKDKKSIIMSGKISVGTNNATSIDPSPQPGREKFQDLIGTIHTHPTNNDNIFTAHGLSAQDYKSFLSDLRQQFMVVAYGESTRLIVLKTSVTPNNLTDRDIQFRINSLEKEFFNGSKNFTKLIIDFNKTACIEFGLTFYLANKVSNDLFQKINVTE